MPSSIVLKRIEHIKTLVRNFRAGSPPLAIRYPASEIANNPRSPTLYPDMDHFMDKLIVAFIPHLQYPELQLHCRNTDDRKGPCGGHYRPDGFVK